jgi:hypothetical protein
LTFAVREAAPTEQEASDKDISFKMSDGEQLGTRPAGDAGPQEASSWG